MAPACLTNSSFLPVLTNYDTREAFEEEAAPWRSLTGVPTMALPNSAGGAETCESTSRSDSSFHLSPPGFLKAALRWPSNQKRRSQTSAPPTWINTDRFKEMQIKGPRPIDTKQPTSHVLLWRKKNPESTVAVKLVVKEGKPVQVSLTSTRSNCILLDSVSGRLAVLFLLPPVKSASKVTLKQSGAGSSKRNGPHPSNQKGSPFPYLHPSCLCALHHSRLRCYNNRLH